MSTSHSPTRVNKNSKGKFGISYDKFKLVSVGVINYIQKCDIDKGIKIYDDRDKPGPNSYHVEREFGSQGKPKFSIGKRLPGRIQSLEKQAFLPSPFHYSIKTDSVLPSKYKRIGFGYGLKSNSKASKRSPGPGEYNLSSFTDRCRPSLYKQTRKAQHRKTYSSIQPSPRDCSLAKPLTGGVFDPMGVVTKDKTIGFNYPPMRLPNFSTTGSTMFYKTDGFRSKKSSSPAPGNTNMRNSAALGKKNQRALIELNGDSNQSSISDMA